MGWMKATSLARYLCIAALCNVVAPMWMYNVNPPKSKNMKGPVIPLRPYS